MSDSQFERLFDKEVRVRKKMLAMYCSGIIYHLVLLHSYNKPKSEFPNLRAYNDYLEQVEDLSSLFFFPVRCDLHCRQFII